MKSKRAGLWLSGSAPAQHGRALALSPVPQISVLLVCEVRPNQFCGEFSSWECGFGVEALKLK